MVRGWFRGGGQSRPDSAPDPARAEMTAAFLELDRRLSVIDEGADAARELSTSPDLPRAWQPVRDQVYAAIDEYLQLSGEPDGQGSSPLDRSGAVDVSGPGRIARCTQDLRDSATRLDRFYREHAGAIEHARAVRGALPTQAAAAERDSDAVLAQARSLPDELAGRTSVRTARADHDTMRSRFDAARADAARADAAPAALATAMSDLAAAIGELRAVIAAAPGRGAQVRRALASVRTRRSAVATRAERLPEAFSALLREFSAACSEDLVGHDRRGVEALHAADHHIDAAAELLDSDPDAADRHVGSARSLLTRAEEYVDAVTDRLDVLREVRNNPARAESRVRFAIRDAQLLAVGRGLVPRWGSVLDAAAARVDRARAAVVGTHPDYWGYRQELTSVEEFVDDVVARMRGGDRS